MKEEAFVFLFIVYRWEILHMAMNFQIPGESIVTYGGKQLALSQDGINVTINFKDDDCIVDSFGAMVGADVQSFLADAYISFSAVFFDDGVLQTAIGNSMGSGTPGTLAHAGTRLGAAGLMLPTVISSPVSGHVWTFPTTYLVNSLGPWPIGTKRSIVQVQFRAMVQTADPWNGGQGANGKVLYSYA